MLIITILAFIISRIVFSVIEGRFQYEKAKQEERLKGMSEVEDDDWSYSKRRVREDCNDSIRRLEDKHNKLKWPRKITNIVLSVLFVISIIGSSIYIIGEQNLAVITTFGKAETVSGTGMHFKIPIIQKVKKLDSTIQGFAIGYQVADNESEYTDSLMITSDFNFVNVDFYVEYRVNDPIMYLYGSSNPEGVLENIAQASIRNTIGMYKVDDVLTTGKSEIQSVIKEDIIKELEKNQTGLTLINITIQDAEAPTEAVNQAFKDVESAKQGKEKAINNAEQYRNEQIPKAKADADAIIKQAEAAKQERIDEATGEVALFNAMYEEYRKNPDVSRIRMYYETMEELMPNLKVIINGSDSEMKPVIIQENSKTTSTQEAN